MEVDGLSALLNKQCFNSDRRSDYEDFLRDLTRQLGQHYATRVNTYLASVLQAFDAPWPVIQVFGMLVVKLSQSPDAVVRSTCSFALEAICNVAIGFTHQNHPIFVQCRGVTQLVQLAKSMDSSIRFKSVCALGNLLFLADEATARSILSELTVSTLANLISDPELLIQKQALALTANFIDGHLDSIEYLLSDDSNIIVAIVRKLHSASSLELCFQGMCVLNNIAAGDESHIEAVMSYVIPLQANECTAPFIIKFMQSKHNKVRTAPVWCIVNLTQPGRYWIGYLLDLEDKVKVKGGVLMQASFLRIKHLEGDGTVLPTHCYSRGE